MKQNYLVKNIILIIRWLIYNDKVSYKRNHNNSNEIFYFNKSKNILYLTIVCIGDKIITNTFTTKLAHEIKHAFQYYKYNFDGINNKLHKSGYYNQRNINPQNEAEKHFKNIIYLSSQREQEAYQSELYTELIKLNPSIYTKVVTQCNPYQLYLSFKRSVNYFKEHKEDNDVQNILKKFNYNYDNFMNKAEQNCKSFIQHLARAITLYEKEKLNNVDYNINITK